MSHILWKSYWENDVDRFRRLVAPAAFGTRTPTKGGGPAVNLSLAAGVNTGASSTSPRSGQKSRKAPGYGPGAKNASVGPAAALGKAEVNRRDHVGLTLLLRAASSTNPNAIAFVEALLDHPAIDLYAQDPESGWNALHRALYAGNIAIARLLLRAEQRIMTEALGGAVISRVGQLIKTKDREGNSPFDLYNSTIAARTADDSLATDDSDTESVVSAFDETSLGLGDPYEIPADELYTFGSNKNLSLGVGDENDRQYPERHQLLRPQSLIATFCGDQVETPEAAAAGDGDVVEDCAIPSLIRERPMHIRDVVLSKFHSAVLTNDPVSNLYVCGIGRGGRLGLGDENTQFRFVPVEGPLSGRRVSQVALGQNHTLAVVGHGELWSWGSNAVSQLGYALPPLARADDEPVSLTPRQVFGSLKKEVIAGVAASAVHSVAHTSSSLYCWGRNLGQLGLMDADSRSLEVQSIPRKVAASLVSSTILMVSAIDKATTCLLATNTVIVFTSYGYNIVKFPAPDIFANTRLGASRSFSHRNLNKIKAITSGGEAIAALSAQGDLFLMNLNHHVDTNSATSTTNPAKIKKSAVSQAQCIWSARKESVTSFSIGEHGSVIISTESGAVWRRIKRTKAKNAAAPGSGEMKRESFKFQRVPAVTNAVTVRSSAFGAFATVRRDCTSVAERIKVTDQTLWDDLASLCPLEGFESGSSPGGKGKVGRKFWDAELENKKVGQTAYQVLKSADLESDLAPYLDMLALADSGFDAVVCTTSAPDLRIPVHEWVLAARSSVLRQALASCRDEGRSQLPEVVKIENDAQGRPTLTFSDVDIICLLSLVLYAYKDEVVPVWNYLREVPHLSFRHRQMRVELMKLAARLNMVKLEAAARMQSRIVKSLDQDLSLAVQDDAFLESGDVLLELDGVEVPAHSYLLRRRCPFFYGLFEGRSHGQWLAGRGDDEQRVRVDLAHFDARAFRYVLLHLYGDVGLELFDETVCPDVDELAELVMDVMSMANELMLDRLSQICQQVISRFVTTRNISNLLNEISPCSVEDFKDAGLEYACLHMEMMLENHLLDDLDGDLIHELDQAVRNNQLARAPFSRSGRAEMLLHEQYPELVEDIEEERRRRVREMAWKATYKDDEKKSALPCRTKVGSLDDGLSASPTADGRPRPKSKAVHSESSTPPLRPKASRGEMMFAMDDDADLHCPESPCVRQADRGAARRPSQPSTPRESESGSFRPGSQRQRRQVVDLSGPVQPPSTPSRSQQPLRPDAATAGCPWSAALLPVDKLDLQSIMSETSGASGPSSSSSNITAGIAAAQKGREAAKATPTRLSQKERKRQQLEASERAAAAELTAQEQQLQSQRAWDLASAAEPKAPWKVAGPRPKTSLKDVMSSAASQAVSPPAPRRTPSAAKHLAAEEAAAAPVQRTASPDTRFAGQARQQQQRNVSSAPSPSSSSSSKKITPHSKSYGRPAAAAAAAPQPEPWLGYSMEDIIVQQRREAELVREAVAKRPLEDIQQEQAFQEWWDQESKRAQEEEESRRVARERGRGDGRARRGRRKERGGGGGGKGAASTPQRADAGQGEEGGRGGGPTPGRGRGMRRRGGAKTAGS